jgi:hypothetical protein
MNLSPNLPDFLAGKLPLPAGSIPLLSDTPGSILCLDAGGQWFRWHWLSRVREPLPSPATQRAVMAQAVAHLGGTSAAAAAVLGYSPRTVEAWRSATDLPPRAAAILSAALASLPKNPAP